MHGAWAQLLAHSDVLREQGALRDQGAGAPLRTVPHRWLRKGVWLGVQNPDLVLLCLLNVLPNLLLNFFVNLQFQADGFSSPVGAKSLTDSQTSQKSLG